MGRVRLFSIVAMIFIGMAATFALLDMYADAQIAAMLAVAVAILAHLE